MIRFKLGSKNTSRRLAAFWSAFLIIVFFVSIANADSIPADLWEIHVLNRLGFGPRAGDIERVQSMGVEKYIDEQLSPGKIPLPESLNTRLESLKTVGKSAPALFVEYGPPSYDTPRDRQAAQRRRQRARVIVNQAFEARVIRAVESPRQLEEVMVNFWFNHFNVFSQKGLDHLWIGSYEEQAIRPYVLGRFRDLLGATAKHLAMLFYLDNWLSRAPSSPGGRGQSKGLNENYARELMELHTLGVDGGYTQSDVITLARIADRVSVPAEDFLSILARSLHSVGSTATAMRESLGTVSMSTPSRLPAKSSVLAFTPVRFPPAAPGCQSAQPQPDRPHL